MSQIENTEIVVAEPVGGNSFLPTVAEIDAQVEIYDKIREAGRQRLVKNIDYGVIPGCQKPSLFKPGAEKLCNFFGLAVESECVEKEIDWENQFAYFRYRTILTSKKNGSMVASGIGSINSKETRYRTQVAKGKFPDIINTLEKMAQKRSHVDATLRATGLSSIYTQDMEEINIKDVGPPPVVDEGIQRSDAVKQIKVGLKYLAEHKIDGFNVDKRAIASTLKHLGVKSLKDENLQSVDTLKLLGFVEHLRTKLEIKEK